jgi:hypothetical protein
MAGRCGGPDVGLGGPDVGRCRAGTTAGGADVTRAWAP